MFTELQYKETTEANFIKRRNEWLGNIGTVPVVDPFIKIFAHDQELLHIQADPKAYETDAWGEYAFNCFAIPAYTQLFSLIFCWPCAIPISKYSGDFNMHANARHLILRENSLVYRVDRGDMLSLNLFDGACFALSRYELTQGIELVFCLDDDIDIVKHQRDDSCSGSDDAHIVYKGKPIAIMRNPQNLDEFIEKFHAQVAATKEKLKSWNLDHHLQRKIHELILNLEQKLANTPLLANEGRQIVRLDLERHKANVMYNDFKENMAKIGVLLEGNMVGAPPVVEIIRDLSMRAHSFVPSPEPDSEICIAYTPPD